MKTKKINKNILYSKICSLFLIETKLFFTLSTMVCEIRVILTPDFLFYTTPLYRYSSSSVPPHNYSIMVSKNLPSRRSSLEDLWKVGSYEETAHFLPALKSDPDWARSAPGWLEFQSVTEDKGTAHYLSSLERIRSGNGVCKQGTLPSIYISSEEWFFFFSVLSQNNTFCWSLWTMVSTWTVYYNL